MQQLRGVWKININNRGRGWGGLRWFFGLLGLGLLFLVITYSLFWLYYRGKVYPGVSVGGFNLNHYSKEEVWRTLDVLERDYLALDSLEIEVGVEKSASDSGKVVVWFDFDGADLQYDPVATTEKVFAWGRSGDWYGDLLTQIKGIQNNTNLNHVYGLDEDYLESVVEEVADAVNKPGVKVGVNLVDRGGKKEVVINQGQDGVVVDKDWLRAKILTSLGQLDQRIEGVEMIIEKNRVDDEKIEGLKERAEKLIDRQLVLMMDENEAAESQWRLEDEDLVGFLDVDGGFSRETITKYVQGLAEAIEREPQNATFKFEGGKVTEFAPGVNGVKLVVSQSVLKIEAGLEEIEKGEKEAVVKLAVRLIPPTIDTPEVNDLGIKELLGRGESTFRGSIAGRVHNVVLTAAKLDGVLIPPGEEFSFNETIGDVSRASGYRSAYVIRDGRTVLGDGGGVCQDSTTLFRAVLDAGLPIVERKAHSYRVGYYEQNSEPGFDATVYAPHPDLRFLNDTPAYILIQARADEKSLSLTIDLYGTNDGRKAEIVNYQKWGAVPAPPPLYQDDPTLAPGEIKQIDWAASGLKVKFDYVVWRDGEKLFEKTFYSNYRPWQAVYLRGV